jgi:hypothetical protein
VSLPVLPQRARRFAAKAHRHERLLWWVHSAYALALGVGFMWLGSRNFGWLRVAAGHITVLWLTSVLLAGVVQRRLDRSPWWRRAQLVINYVNKNLYQQVLFFILPVYYASATGWSANMAFVVLLAVSAIVSTIDVVYDRVLTARRWLAAAFFSFNAFALVNVALPVLFGVANHLALRAATAAAILGLVTIALRAGEWRRPTTWAALAGGSVVVLLASEAARPLVPPAPLRLRDTHFGLGLDRRTLRVARRAASVPAGPSRVFVVAAVEAPAGLRDRVALHWYRGGTLVHSSAPHELLGGRADGFRLWTSLAVPAGAPAGLRLDVVTGAGQLIGRATLPGAVP